MARRLVIAPRARKELAALPQRERRAIATALDQLTRDFGSADVKKLSGQSARWRLRVGRWRVILTLDNETDAIDVTRVLPRDRAYRD